MKKAIKIPEKLYFKKAYRIVSALIEKNTDFNRIRRLIFNSEDLQNLMKSIGIKNTYEISSGTSDRIAFGPYLDKICSDIKKSYYYREYTTAKGSLEARKALAIFESIKFQKLESYSVEDICLTEGATEAISLFFEYFKNNFKNKEIIIGVPNYYISKFAAKYFNLKVKEVLTLNKEKSFVSVNQIINAISNKTKLIILTNPSNPSGELFTRKDLKKLIRIAKQKNIFIMIDELFCELVFNIKEYADSDLIARELKALNNLIIIKGYSKTKNLAAFRIGYVLTKNREITNSIAKIAEQRRCFPSASNNTGLICLDSFIQSVFYQINMSEKSILEIIYETKNKYESVKTIYEMNIKELEYVCIQYQKYLKKTLDFYSTMFDKASKILDQESLIKCKKQSAFNTFIKIKNLSKVNFFDFILNLYLTTGVKIEIGPGFGFDQRRWETDKKLGFWLRITFAKDKICFTEGLKKFIEFKNIYVKNREKFLQTNLYF